MHEQNDQEIDKKNQKTNHQTNHFNKTMYPVKHTQLTNRPTSSVTSDKEQMIPVHHKVELYVVNHEISNQLKTKQAGILCISQGVDLAYL